MTVTTDAPSVATVRAWAKENGYTVGQRGSLPATVVEAYTAAHPA